MNLKHHKYKIVNLVFNPIVGDARVQRVSQLLAERGYDISICSLENGGMGLNFSHPNITHLPLSKEKIFKQSENLFFRKLFNKVFCLLPLKFNRQLTQYFYYLDINFAAQRLISQLNADLVICNNFESLKVGYYLKRKLGIPFVYDAHELETDRSTSRTKIQRLYVKFFEWFYARNSSIIFTVSEGIGKILAERFRKPKVQILHNMPFSLSNSTGLTVRQDVGMNPEMKLLVYVGAVTEPRKLDILIEMMSFLPQAQLCFVGKRDEDYVSKLQKLSKKLGIENRIWFRGPVHHEQVVNYISGSDLSFVLIPNSSLSYKLSLPNKFFESILAKVPIAIYSHSEEMIKMFGDQTGSLRLDTLSAKELASQVQKFLDSSSPTLSNRLTKSQKFLKKGTLERIEFVKSIESFLLK